MGKTTDKKRGLISKIIKITLITIGSVIGVIILGILGVTLWLTPERLAKIVNEESDKYVNANVHVSSIDYHIWTSFPYLKLEIDSLDVHSKVLESIDNCREMSIPEGSDQLISISDMKGSINVFKLIRKIISLKNVEINNLNLNVLQINDSLGNYNILSKAQIDKLKQFKINGFNTDSFILKGNNLIQYRNLPKEFDIRMKLDSVIMVNEKRDSKYAFDFNGKLSVDANYDSILNNIPLNLQGEIVLPTDLKYAGLENFTVGLDNLKLKFDLLANIDKNIQISKFDYILNPLDVFSLLPYLPTQSQAYINDLSGKLLIKSKGKLLHPYNPLNDTIPMFTSDLSFFDGEIAYKNFKISDITGELEVRLNGKDRKSSFIDLHDLSIKGEGLNLTMGAKVKKLLSETPFFDCDLKLQGSLEKLGNKIPKIKNMSLNGNSKIDSKISFYLNYNNGISLQDVNCSAKVAFNDMRINPETQMKAGVKKVDISLSGKIEEFATDRFKINNISTVINSSGISFTTPDLVLKGDNLKLNGELSSKGNINATLNNIIVNNRKDSLNLSAGTINIRSSQTNNNITGNGKIDMVKVNSPAAGIDINDISFNGNIFTKSLMQNAAKLSVRNSHITDVTTEDTPRHTPEFIRFNLADKAQQIINNIKGSLGVKVKSGNLKTKAFPVDNRFSDIDVFSNIDNLKINNIKFKSGGCAITLTGLVENLREFMISEGNKTLKSNFNLSIDTLNLPRIARIYENGVANTSGIDKTLPVPKPPVSASDSAALLIPRNLDISVNASANHLLYTDLDLSDLSTLLAVKDGDARIGNLKVSAPFGKAAVDVVYSTADIRNMYLDFNADMQEFELVDFFECYKNTLIKAMPYLSNLSGDLSAIAKGRISIFPTMYFDIPSMTASLDFKSRKLSVHQNKFIRRITRLMLIHTSEDIQIPNLNIKASVHDNLIELDPFNFIFNRYTLNLSGINNLNGDMFYHIAIMKSPVPFPFAFNIKGTFAHPKLRFGGARLKTDDTEKVAADVRESKPLEINMTQNLKYGFMEFLKTAAAEDTTNNSGYIFPVLVNGK